MANPQAESPTFRTNSTRPLPTIMVWLSDWQHPCTQTLINTFVTMYIPALYNFCHLAAGCLRKVIHEH